MKGHLSDSSIQKNLSIFCPTDGMSNGTLGFSGIDGIPDGLLNSRHGMGRSQFLLLRQCAPTSNQRHSSSCPFLTTVRNIRTAFVFF